MSRLYLEVVSGLKVNMEMSELINIGVVKEVEKLTSSFVVLELYGLKQVLHVNICRNFRKKILKFLDSIKSRFWVYEWWPLDRN